MAAVTLRSDAAVFYTDQRTALLSDPSITERKMFGTTALFDPGHGRTSKTWASVFVSARDRWPQLAQEARAFLEG
jgi:hypothetical protein